MTDEQPSPSEPWQRLTVLDLLLFFPAYGLGCMVAQAWVVEARSSFENPPPWPAEAGSVELLITAVALGNLFAGPLVLAVQWAVRRRRCRLSTGEWLWLGPLIVWLLAYLVSMVASAAALGWFFLSVFVIFDMAVVAVLLLGFWIARRRGSTPCPWTDVFGAAACLLIGIVVLRAFLISPITI